MLLFNNRPLVIIGMHRSGTGMISKIVHKSGIFMGAKKTGNFESVLFQEINRSIFKANGRTWVNPSDNNWEFKYFNLNVKSPFRNYIRLNPLNMFKKQWGWKDPRNTYTLPFWLTLFPEAKVLHVYRDGIDVAISLHKRSIKMDRNHRDYSERTKDIIQCFRLWEEYVNKAFSYAAILERSFLSIRFEKIIEGNMEEIDSLEDFLETDIKEKLFAEVDCTRTKRYKNGEYLELVEFARKSKLMNKLGYLV